MFIVVFDRFISIITCDWWIMSDELTIVMTVNYWCFVSILFHWNRVSILFSLYLCMISLRDKFVDPSIGGERVTAEFIYLDRSVSSLIDVSFASYLPVGNDFSDFFLGEGGV
jgi:hypothetical protein